MTRRARDLGTRGDGRYRVVDEARIVANLVRNLFPYEAAQSRDDADAAARALLERWIAAGLPVALERGRRLFDPCEAVNFSRAAWDEDGDPAWYEHQVLSSRRMVREMREAPTGAALPVTFRREYNLAGIAAGSRLRLRMPLPIDESSVEAIAIDAAATAAGATSAMTPGRLEVRFMLPAQPRESVAVATTLRVPATTSGLRWEDVEAGAPAATTGAKDVERWLRRDEGLIRVSAAVVEQGAALAPADASAKAVVSAIWDYFTTAMRVSFIHYDELDPVDPMRTVLTRRWCDCHVGSSLFAALCRARGIPARVVTGVLLYPVTASQHTWLEVLLPPHGWLPVDLTGCMLAAGKLGDREWSGSFLGHVDPRMTTQRLPDVFTGAVGVGATPCWYLLQTLEEGGTDMTIGCLDARAWLWRDRLRVEPPARAT